MKEIEILSRGEMKDIKGGTPAWCNGIAETLSIWGNECTELATEMGSWASADCHADLAKTKLLADNICGLSAFT
ncbi:MAG: hypothetical protein BalsKO_06220 [Balneolaceae bacterium]